MLTTRAACITLLLVIFSITAVLAQKAAPSDPADSLTVTVSLFPQFVRFTAPPATVQMRLEVYTATAKKLYDHELRNGNVLDWPLLDGQAQPLADANYLCVVTVKSLSGQFTQRLGSLTLQQHTAQFQATVSMTARQLEAIGAVEDQAGLRVLDATPTTTTAMAADGQLQAVMNRRAGTAVEDSASSNLVNLKTRLEAGQPLSPGAVIVSPQVSGSGTQNRLAKWLDNLGTLGDANLTDLNGNVGINTIPDSRFKLDINGSTRIQGANPGFNLEGLRAAGNIWLFQTVDTDGRFRLFSQDNVNPGVERLTIKLDTGNVGIGSTTANSKLTVGGVIESTSGGLKFPDGTTQTTAGLPNVAHDTTLSGMGTTGNPLIIAPGGVGNSQLANNAVTGSKIAAGEVVKSVNGLTDQVNLQAGTNITITANGNDLTIGATGLEGVLDDALRRGSRRAALQQFWMPQTVGGLKSIPVGSPNDITCDGRYLWATVGGRVAQVDAADGVIVRFWTGAIDARKIIAAAGRIFFTEPLQNGGRIYVIDPANPNPPVATVFENNTGISPFGITFDGTYLWTANRGDGPTQTGGSLTRVAIDNGVETTFTTGFTVPFDILWDGANLWATDILQQKLKRINRATGAVIEDIDVGAVPTGILFDGTYIWLTSQGSNSILIIRPGNPSTIIRTLTGNGLDEPYDLAFDGERVMVTCRNGDRVSLFRATDFSPLGFTSTGLGSSPEGVCSDGLNFWITRHQGSDIVRY